MAAFDPVTNLRVGVQVLKECIQRAGSLEDGLRFYVGGANLAEDTGYTARVLAEHDLLQVPSRLGRAPVLSQHPPSCRCARCARLRLRRRVANRTQVALLR